MLSKLGVDNFNLVDIGSSFNLFEPFNIIEKVWEKDLSILCFEPNEDTIIFKSKASRININKALWNKEDTVDFHIAINKSESSIYPPDIKLLKIFDEKHWKNRQTAEVVKTKTTTLDLETKNHKFNPDFIKIDTQGAEYEILEGSKDTLKKGVFGLLLETWSYPFHKNQKLVFEVMKLMDENGYFLVDLDKGGYYRRQSLDDSILYLGHIGVLDLLYFEKFDKFVSSKKTDDEIIKAACIADLYGMSDYAIDILNYYDNFDVLINKIKLKRKTKIKKVSNQWRVEKLKTLLKFNPRTPPLH